jgi:hypothetical protein
MRTGTQAATALAVGAVGEDAAAPEAVAHQLAVDLGGDQVRRRGDLEIERWSSR